MLYPHHKISEFPTYLRFIFCLWKMINDDDAAAALLDCHKKRQVNEKKKSVKIVRIVDDLKLNAPTNVRWQKML